MAAKSSRKSARKRVRKPARKSARKKNPKRRVGKATYYPPRGAKSAPRKAAPARASPPRRKAAAVRKAPARPSRAATRPTRRAARSMPEGALLSEVPLEREPMWVSNDRQERDYLVVYEEPDEDGMTSEDALLLDIDAGQPVSLGELDVEQKLDLELSNNTNWVGRLGFVLAVVGAIIGFAILGFFGFTYPDSWYTESGEIKATSLVPTTALVAVVSVLLMLAGVVLTHYGRRIQARGQLSRIRIVEKAFQPRVALGD